MVAAAYVLSYSSLVSSNRQSTKRLDANASKRCLNGKWAVTYSQGSQVPKGQREFIDIAREGEDLVPKTTPVCHHDIGRERS